MLSRYRQVAADVKMAGPTSFAPIIDQACEIVRSEKSYTILLILADGQVRLMLLLVLLLVLLRRSY